MREKMLVLSDCGIEVIGGQIMSRITVKDAKNEEVADTRRVLVPKCISTNGVIDAADMPTEQLRSIPDVKRITEVGDIVMKLSTPYDAGRIDEASAGCIVPSFCVIIKSTAMLDPAYLLAFLNSSTCKNQLKAQMAGATIALLSVGKIKNLLIPVPSLEKQREIGSHYMETQRKLSIMEQIIALEQKKNDIYFREMVNGNEQE